MDTAKLRAFAMLVCACLEGMQRVQSHCSRALFCVVLQNREEPPPARRNFLSALFTAISCADGCSSTPANFM